MKRGLVLQRFLVCAVAAIVSFESADLRAEVALDTSSTDVATESPRTNSAGLDEIVVTARRRSEDNQQEPIAITAFNAQDIQRLGIVSGFMLGSQSPSLNFQEAPYDSFGSFIGIRVQQATEVIITQ